MAVEQSTTINAPAEKVFAYVADITKHPEWTTPGHKVEIKKTSEGPVAVGSTFESTGQQFGANHDTLTVTELAENQRIVYEADGNAGLIGHTFELSPADGGTQLTKRFDIMKPKFPLNVLSPILQAFVLPGGLKGDLERIKAKLEAS